MAGLKTITYDGVKRNLTPLSTAPKFSGTTSYAVGEYCFYDGTLYRCTTAHTGVWNASHFTAVTISGELQAKATEIEDLKTDLTQLGESVGYIALNRTAPIGTVLFTSADVEVGQTLFYDFTVEASKACFIEFLDSSNTRITYIGKGSSGGGDTRYFGTYVIPSNFATCKVSGTVGAVMTVNYMYINIDNRSLNKSIEATAEKVNELFTVANIDAVPTSGGLYSRVTKAFYPNPDYEYYLLPVTEADKVYVTAMSNTNVPIAMFYSDAETMDSTTWLGSQGSYSSSVQYTDELLAIPSGTKMIAINNRLVGNFGIKKALPSTEADKQIHAKYDGSNVTMVSNGLRVAMGYRGGNNLFDFISFTDADTDKTLLTNNTDFFGPYKVRAVSNGDGDKPTNWYSHFTGGNHQYNNSGSGSTPTARGSIDFVKFDGETATENSSAYCNRVEIQWTNYIQGQNTKKEDGTGREILKEVYNLVFDGFKFEIQHHFIPLEDVIILTYYGLQLYNNTANCKYRYVGGTNRAELSAPIASDSGNKACRKIIMANTTLSTSMEMNETDLGDFCLDSSAYSVFTSSSNKAYFMLINPSTNTTFEADDYYYFNGSYVFEKLT